MGKTLHSSPLNIRKCVENACGDFPEVVRRRPALFCRGERLSLETTTGMFILGCCANVVVQQGRLWKRDPRRTEAKRRIQGANSGLGFTGKTCVCLQVCEAKMLLRETSFPPPPPGLPF